MMHIVRGGGGALFFKYRNRNVYAGINNAVCGSSIKWREKSYAASVTSDLPNPKPCGKNVRREQRKAIVETYVNKYRAAHDGKFPTVTDIVKGVGGSYYYTKWLLQELQYKSKMSASNDKNESLSGEEHTIESESLTKVEELTTIAERTCDKLLKAEGAMQASPKDENTLFEEVSEPTIPIEGKSCEDAFPSPEKSKDGKVEEAQDGRSEFVVMENHLPRAVEESSPKSLEKPDNKTKNIVRGFGSEISETERTLQHEESVKVDYPFSEDADRKDTVQKVSEGEKQARMVSEGFLDFDVPEHKATNVSNRETNDTEPPKKSTLWGNLKSFAINIWRKL